MAPTKSKASAAKPAAAKPAAAKPAAAKPAAKAAKTAAKAAKTAVAAKPVAKAAANAKPAAAKEDDDEDDDFENFEEDDIEDIDDEDIDEESGDKIPLVPKNAAQRANEAALAAIKMLQGNKKAAAQNAVTAAGKKGAKNAKVDLVPGTIYIGRIPHGFYEKQMRKFFSQFGEIKHVRLMRNKKTGKSRHFAFVQFVVDEVAKIAAETMNDYLMFGRLLKCQFVAADRIPSYAFSGPKKPGNPSKAVERARRALSVPKTQAQYDKKVERLIAKDAKKRQTLKELGVEYDFAGFAGALAVQKKKKATTTPAKASKSSVASKAAAEIKTPKAAEVKTAEAKTPKAAEVKTAEVKTPKAAEVKTAEVKTPKAAEVKTPKAAEVKTPKTASDAKTPKTAADAKTPKTAADAKTPKTAADAKTPKTAADAKTPKTVAKAAVTPAAKAVANKLGSSSDSPAGKKSKSK